LSKQFYATSAHQRFHTAWIRSDFGNPLKKQHGGEITGPRAAFTHRFHAMPLFFASEMAATPALPITAPNSPIAMPPAKAGSPSSAAESGEPTHPVEFRRGRLGNTDLGNTDSETLGRP
jgi:hypothetical protein